MQRDEWIFEYCASDLAKAAAHKREHHKARLAWRESKKADVMAEVRESGIEVSESLADSHLSARHNMGPQVMVRNDLQRMLTECHARISKHDSLIRDYHGWHQVLSGNPKARLKLHHDDWLFFFAG